MTNENPKVKVVGQRAGDPVTMKTAEQPVAPTQPSILEVNPSPQVKQLNDGVIQAPPEAAKGQAGFDAKAFIKGSETSLNRATEQETEKQRIHKLLTAAFESMTNFDRTSYFNEETQEVIGTKIRYLPDRYGKTVYDYAADPDVASRLVIVIDEDDPQDSSEIDKQVSHYWINPIY